MTKVRLPALRNVLAVLLLAGSASAAPATDRFTPLTDFFAEAEHGGFYEAGLDVDVRQGGPQVNAMQLLLAGQVDAIVGVDFQVLQAIENGLPVVAVDASLQHDLQGMMTHEDMKGLGDLKDRTILIASVGRVTFWSCLKAKYGYTDAQTKAYTFNLQPFFADPNTAQHAYPSSEPFQARDKGVPVNFFLFADDGYPPYGSTVVVTRKTLDERPEVLRAFLKVSMRGWRDYMANPASGDALIKAANPRMGNAQIAFGIAKMRDLHVLDGDDNAPIGTMTEARWKATDDYMVEAGLLKPGTDWRRAFTTEFIGYLDAKLK